MTMLAADKLLLRSTVKQRTIELREKELNLFNSNFSAVATQAALLAGFSMAFLEMSVHLHGVHFNPLAKGLLHLFSTLCVCANIFVVSIITFVSVWGSGKALRGRDGSMGMVVEGMNKERWLIFYTFGVGLLSLLIAVACSTWLLMQREVALLATVRRRGPASCTRHGRRRLATQGAPFWRRTHAPPCLRLAGDAAGDVLRPREQRDPDLQEVRAPRGRGEGGAEARAAHAAPFSCGVAWPANP